MTHRPLSVTPMIVGIPAFCERAWLPATLHALSLQTETVFEVWVIVNQAATYFDDPEKAAVTAENLATIDWLRASAGDWPFALHVIDAVRPPLAPRAKKAGVGWARDQLFRQAIDHHGREVLCVSLDADTLIGPHYLAAVRDAFESHPHVVGLAVPYYHPLPADSRQARNLLRYEIYMRYYQLNLWRIGSPYAFSALGSAIAFRASHFQRGFPHRQAGEDFYFLQQLTKTGTVLRWLSERVYPSPRSSNRTPFGTGPLIAATDLDDLDQRFPFYPLEHFDRLAVTFARFGELYQRDVPLPIDDYLNRALGRTTIEKLRRNHSTKPRFVRACHEWIDGLRTLQCLRWHLRHHGGDTDPSMNLSRLLLTHGKASVEVDFANDPIPHLANLRDLLVELEGQQQQEHDRLCCSTG